MYQIGGVELNLKIQVLYLYFLKYLLEILLFIELDLEKVMSPDEKKKLYDAIGYEGEDTSTSTYPEEVCSDNLY